MCVSQNMSRQCIEWDVKMLVVKMKLCLLVFLQCQLTTDYSVLTSTPLMPWNGYKYIIHSMIIYMGLKSSHFIVSIGYFVRFSTTEGYNDGNDGRCSHPCFSRGCKYISSTSGLVLLVLITKTLIENYLQWKRQITLSWIYEPCGNQENRTFIAAELLLLS